MRSVCVIALLVAGLVACGIAAAPALVCEEEGDRPARRDGRGDAPPAEGPGPRRGGPGAQPPPPPPPPPFELGKVLPPHVRDDIDLSEEQEQQVDKLEQEVKERLQKILTPEQRKKVRDMRRGGRPPMGGPHDERGRPPMGGPQDERGRPPERGGRNDRGGPPDHGDRRGPDGFPRVW